jgi:pimeloyl-ACP methyl ester carboxylesterase
MARAPVSSVTVDGAEIRYWTWGDGDGPPLMLVHGGGAHTGWWEPVIPHLDPNRKIVSLDLSGHGDSGRREAYPIATWAEEVAAVIEAAIGGPAVVVGHSMGGRVAPLIALHHPELVEALVIVDSAMPLPPSFNAPASRPAKVYATEEEALARFRLMPEQPATNPELVAQLGRRSVKPVDGGWTWKFDPRIFARLDQPAPEDALPHLKCPVSLVQGELSDVTDPALAADFARRLGRPAPLVTMPGVYHHVMLDDPEGLAAILDWLPETRVRTSAAAPGFRR